MEQVFYRVHIRIVSSFCALSGPSIRSSLERVLLTLSIASLCAFSLMHHSFTSTYIDHQCFQNSFLGIDGADPQRFPGMGVTHIYITDKFSSYNTSHNSSSADYFDKNISIQHAGVDEFAKEESIASLLSSYMYSPQRGLLVLPPHSRELYNISQATFYLPSDIADKCFHMPFLQSLQYWVPVQFLNRIFGYDTIMLNLLRKITHDDGFLYIENRRKLIDLSFYSHFIFSVATMNSFGNPVLWDQDVEAEAQNKIKNSTLKLNRTCPSNADPTRKNDDHSRECTPPSDQYYQLYTLRDKIFLKFSIVVTATFLYFAMTSMVSFILKQTQSRMLKFTFLLQYHVRNHIPYSSLVFVHVFESLIFVPIMLGVLFFLFEIFSDKLFSFMLISLVWISEVYSVMSLRTYMSIYYFPKMLFLYFHLLHLYIFSCPFGFTYSALFTLVLFEFHLMLYFLNAFEIPAYASGNISAIRPRYFYTTNAPAVAAISNATVSTVGITLPPSSASMMTVSSTVPGGHPPMNPFPIQHGGLPPRNFSAVSLSSVLSGNDTPTISNTPAIRRPSQNSERKFDSSGADRIDISRTTSFSTPLEEIIAYEHAMQRQQNHIQSQEESTEFMYMSSLPPGSVPRQLSEADGLMDRDIGLSLLGSDMGDSISDRGISRSTSITDMDDASSLELRNVSKALQFELSKQIQNEQMAALLAYDLPVPSSLNVSDHQTSTVLSYQTVQHNSIGEDVIVSSDATHKLDLGKRHVVNEKKTSSTSKKSSVFSLFSNLKWGRNKNNNEPSQHTPPTTAATSMTINDPHAEVELKSVIDDMDGIPEEITTSKHDDNDHKKSNGDNMEASDCISLSSPFASSALENLQSQKSPSSSLHTMSQPPTSPTRMSNYFPNENYSRENHRMTTSRHTLKSSATQVRAHGYSESSRIMHTESSAEQLITERSEELYLKDNDGFSIFGMSYGEDSD